MGNSNGIHIYTLHVHNIFICIHYGFYVYILCDVWYIYIYIHSITSAVQYSDIVDL